MLSCKTSRIGRINTVGCLVLTNSILFCMFNVKIDGNDSTNVADVFEDEVHSFLKSV